MRNRVFYVVTIVLVPLLILCGCTAIFPEQNEVVNKKMVKLYFADLDNSNYVIEERGISYTDEDDKYRVTLEQLIKGPKNKDHRANISPDAKVYGTIRQNDDLIVDFSREFQQFQGSVSEIIAVGSVVNTMAQFGIIRVKILVEGEELAGPSGMPRGFMQAEDRITDTNQERIVKLYFSNPDDASLKSESRIIKTHKDISREQILLKVLEELIAGPTGPGLNKTIPPKVRVLSIEISGETAIINFSEEMHSQHWGGATGESITINSIVNSLTEFYYVKEVKMMVTGQPMTIEHIVLEDPVRRNDAVIQQ